MKGKNGCKGFVVFFASVIALCTVVSAWGDLRSGGKPITPYKRAGGVSKDEVTKIRETASKWRVIEEGGIPILEQVGLMYVKGENVSGEPFFKVEGDSESGKKVTVDFSEIHAFSILKVDDPDPVKPRALLEIVKFPVISPEELLAKQYSYSDLLNDFKKTIRLWVDLKDEENSELCFVGKQPHQDKYEVYKKLRDIKAMVDYEQAEEEREVTGKRLSVLGYGWFLDQVGGRTIRRPTIWFAIDSVIQDQNYPHRLYMLK